MTHFRTLFMVFFLTTLAENYANAGLVIDGGQMSVLASGAREGFNDNFDPPVFVPAVPDKEASLELEANIVGTHTVEASTKLNRFSTTFSSNRLNVNSDTFTFIGIAKGVGSHGRLTPSTGSSNGFIEFSIDQVGTFDYQAGDSPAVFAIRINSLTTQSNIFECGEPFFTGYGSFCNVSFPELELDSGSYTIEYEIRSQIATGVSIDTNLSFSVTLVPIPGSVWLFLSGIAYLLSQQYSQRYFQQTT